MSVVLARSRLPRRGLSLALAGAVPVLAFGAAAVLADRGAAAPAAQAPAAQATAARATTAPAPVREQHDCSGAETPVTVELTPEAIADDRMTVAIDVHHHLDDAAALVGAVEVIDDRGRRMGPARDLEVRAVPARSRAAYRIETPDRLADGYYRAQVSVLARAGGTDDFSTHQLYFHVEDGSLTPITSHDWLTRSASGLAFQAR